MFESVGPGADSAVSGLVALLATAQALKNVTETLVDKNVSTNVMFVIFNGVSKYLYEDLFVFYGYFLRNDIIFA